MSPQNREFPDSWCSDELTGFIDKANSNVVGTFINDKNEYPHVSSIDNIYQSIVRALVNPQAIIEAIMLIRTHSTFRASVWLAMAGMNPEAFVQMRSCLETSLYALHMSRNPGSDETWLERHIDKDSLKATKQQFTYRNVIDTLNNDDPNIGAIAANLYEITIDFGAHPNERAVTANLDIEEIEDGRRFQQAYLSGGTVQQRHSMKSCAQTGLCSLYIFRLIFRERFDILGLTERMDQHRDVLYSHIKSLNTDGS